MVIKYLLLIEKILEIMDSGTVIDKDKKTIENNKKHDID